MDTEQTKDEWSLKGIFDAQVVGRRSRGVLRKKWHNQVNKKTWIRWSQEFKYPVLHKKTMQNWTILIHNFLFGYNFLHNIGNVK